MPISCELRLFGARLHNVHLSTRKCFSLNAWRCRSIGYIALLFAIGIEGSGQNWASRRKSEGSRYIKWSCFGSSTCVSLIAMIVLLTNLHNVSSSVSFASLDQSTTPPIVASSSLNVDAILTTLWYFLLQLSSIELISYSAWNTMGDLIVDQWVLQKVILLDPLPLRIPMSTINYTCAIQLNISWRSRYQSANIHQLNPDPWFLNYFAISDIGQLKMLNLTRSCSHHWHPIWITPYPQFRLMWITPIVTSANFPTGMTTNWSATVIACIVSLYGGLRLVKRIITSSGKQRVPSARFKRI